MAKKVKRILFNATWYESGSPKYVAGQHYPVTEETQRQVGVGIAEEIEVAPAEAEQADLLTQRDAAADVDLQAAEIAENESRN